MIGTIVFSTVVIAFVMMLCTSEIIKSINNKNKN